MNPPTRLLVEDDSIRRQELAEFLPGEGFAVHQVELVDEAEQALQSPFDLMVLDLDLPDGSGADLCRRLRPYLRLGIVICSGLSDRELRLSLLRAGADAFLVKPVDLEELAASLHSVLRRVTPAPPSPMRVGAVPMAWRLDRVQRALLVAGGRKVGLSAAEGLLLLTLFRQPDRVVERPQLLEAFDQAGMPMSGPRLEILISRLRSKVYATCGLTLPLRAQYRRGYVFSAHADVL